MYMEAGAGGREDQGIMKGPDRETRKTGNQE